MTDKVNIMTDAGADVAQVSLAVANRIRSWRKEKKLSLDELSRRASVSKGMLVEIEKGCQPQHCHSVQTGRRAWRLGGRHR